MATGRKIKTIEVNYKDGGIEVFDLTLPKVSHAQHWEHDRTEYLPGTTEKTRKIVHEIRWIVDGNP